MSEKMIPEREVVKRERAAFDRGYRTYRFVFDNQYEVATMTGLRSEEAEALAEVIDREYPLPKVYRTFNSNGVTYRVRDGQLEYNLRDEWIPSATYSLPVAKAFVDLAENPFEAE